MRAVETRLLPFLQKASQFIIPIYQRNYSWTAKECQQLWDDIIRVGVNDAVTVHFIGSVVYVEEGLSQVSSRAPLWDALYKLGERDLPSREWLRLKGPNVTMRIGKKRVRFDFGVRGNGGKYL